MFNETNITDKRFFQDVVNQLDCLFIYLSPNNIVEIANDFAIKLLGLDLKKYNTVDFYVFCKIHHYSLANLLKIIDKPLQLHEEIYIIQKIKYIIEWKIISFHDSHQRLNGRFLIGINKTHFKFLEKELKTRILFYENILSKLPTNVYWKDRNSVYLGCNERLAQVMGLPSREAIKGMTDFDFAWGKEAAESFIALDQKVMQLGKPLTTEDTFKEANGNLVTVLTNKTPLRNEKNKIVGILAISVDITQRKKLEEELVATKAREERFKAMSAISGMIAHELRTPITGVALGLLEIQERLPILLETYKKHSTEKKQNLLTPLQLTNLEKVCQNISHLLTLAENTVNTILVGFRQDQVAATKLTSINLRNILQKFRSQYLLTSEDTNLITIAPMNDLFIIGSEPVILHTLTNLLKNSLYAIKEVQKGEITILAEEREDKIELYFKDTAKGITKENLEKIFEPFYTTKDTSTSIGIGLYFCKLALQNTLGDIICNSEEGKYTIFTLFFPKAKNIKNLLT